MRTSYVLLSMAVKNPIIKNINLPSCKNCIYYNVDKYNDFTSTLNTCQKFGVKDIITDVIRYDYADICRNDESKCGKDGKFFEEEPDIRMKMWKNLVFKNMYIGLVTVPFIVLALEIAVARYLERQ